jgi:hypothetical protein
MKLNRLRRIAAVGVLWLCVSVGCSKDPLLPACENGKCCWEGYTPKFVKRLDDAPAEYGGSGFVFKDILIEESGYKLDRAIICRVHWDMVNKMNLKNNMTIDPKTNKVRLIDSTRQYPYRVWGIVYEIPEIPNFGAIPTLAVRIEKVEEVK